LHNQANAINDIANAVDVYTNTTIITATNHGLSGGDQSWILVRDGDTANVSNGYHIVTNVAGANTFNIKTTYPVTQSGNVFVHQKNTSIIITGHAASNGNTVYVTFTSNDQANTANGIYSPVKISANEFRISTTKVASSNASVRVYYSTNTYTNVRFTRASHGFSANSNTWVEFNSAGIANGVFTVRKVYDTNTYNVVYLANTYVSGNTINYSGLSITENVVMEGIASVAPYK
jgi:hypothetical protein